MCLHFRRSKGTYTFRFDYRKDRVGVWIDYGRANGGLIATLTGVRKPLSNRIILNSLWRRPFGARRAVFLIHWQALKLWVKRARFSPFRTAPVPDRPDIAVASVKRSALRKIKDDDL